METVREIVLRVEKIANDFQISALDRQNEACLALEREGATVDVVVIGQFKSGKSSFLNSLVGRDVLPTVGTMFGIGSVIMMLAKSSDDTEAIRNAIGELKRLTSNH